MAAIAVEPPEWPEPVGPAELPHLGGPRPVRVFLQHHVGEEPGPEREARRHHDQPSTAGRPAPPRTPPAQAVEQRCKEKDGGRGPVEQPAQPDPERGLARESAAAQRETRRCRNVEVGERDEQERSKDQCRQARGRDAEGGEAIRAHGMVGARRGSPIGQRHVVRARGSGLKPRAAAGPRPPDPSGGRVSTGSWRRAARCCRG